MSAGKPAIEDYAAIRAAMSPKTAQKKGCAIKDGTAVSECWCFHAKPDGDSFPCPPASEQDPYGY